MAGGGRGPVGEDVRRGGGPEACPAQEGGPAHTEATGDRRLSRAQGAAAAASRGSNEESREVVDGALYLGVLDMGKCQRGLFRRSA